jgi:hypothetical protein
MIHNDGRADRARGDDVEEPVTGTEPTGTADAGQTDRAPWSAPRLAHLDAAVTGASGFMIVDAGDTLSVS